MSDETKPNVTFSNEKEEVNNQDTTQSSEQPTSSTEGNNQENSQNNRSRGGGPGLDSLLASFLMPSMFGYPGDGHAGRGNDENTEDEVDKNVSLHWDSFNNLVKVHEKMLESHMELINTFRLLATGEEESDSEDESDDDY